VDEEKHDRTRTKVERDIPANKVPRVALHWQPKAALLDDAHPDRRGGPAAAYQLSIREQATVRHDRLKVIDVRDVIELRASRGRAHVTSP
jgi:hypothetical protein